MHCHDAKNRVQVAQNKTKKFKSKESINRNNGYTIFVITFLFFSCYKKQQKKLNFFFLLLINNYNAMSLKKRKANIGQCFQCLFGNKANKEIR